MEQYNQDFKRVDNNLLVATHLCQLLTYVSGFGGLVVPLVLWLTQKDKVASMDIQGKQIVNFQLSIIVYYILSIPLILFFWAWPICSFCSGHTWFFITYC